jgi:hypothetical protein
MSFFDQIKAKIFPDPAAIEQGKMPVLTDVIRRDERYIIEYEKWRNSEDKEDLLEWIREEYNNEAGSDWITRLKSKGVRGFLIHGDEEGIGPVEAQYLLDNWKTRIRKLNYRLYSSHAESYIRENKVLFKERYYLKPQIQDFNPPVDQEYGNILLESEVLDQSLLSIKCVVTFYSGYNYKQPKEYDDFIDHLFNSKGI